MGGYLYPYTLLLHFKTSEMCNMFFYCWIFCILSLVVSNNKVHNYLLSSVHSYLFGNKDHFDKFITRLLNFVVLVKYSNFISEAHVQQCDFRVNTNAFRWTDKSQFRSVSTRFFFFYILNIEYLTSWFSATYRNW